MWPNAEAILDVFLPRRCLKCLTAIGNNVFCAGCESLIKQVSPLGETENIVSMFLYGSVLRELLLQAKFNSNEAVGRSLARYLYHSLDKSVYSHFLSKKYDAIAYIPSHWQRRFSRKFELSFLLACAIAKKTKTPCLHLLKSIRHDKALSTLPSAAQREIQVQGRFTLLRRNLRPLNILLVDDILTTGATLREGMKTLERGGHHAEGFAFTRTPLS